MARDNDTVCSSTLKVGDEVSFITNKSKGTMAKGIIRRKFKVDGEVFFEIEKGRSGALVEVSNLQVETVWVDG